MVVVYSAMSAGSLILLPFIDIEVRIYLLHIAMKDWPETESKGDSSRDSNPESS